MCSMIHFYKNYVYIWRDSKTEKIQTMLIDVIFRCLDCV